MAADTPPNPGLLTLPPEVLSTIASHLKVYIYDFILVSKRCYEVGKRYTYSSDPVHKVFAEDNQSEVGYTETYQWLKELLANPESAGRVRRLSGFGHGYEDELDGEWLVDDDNLVFDKGDWKRILDHVRGTWNEIKGDELLKGLLDGKWEHAMIIILSLLWNLEEVIFESWGDHNEVLGVYLEAASRCQAGQRHDYDKMDISSALSRLRKVTLHYYDTEGCFEPEALEVWGQLRSVKVLVGQMIGREDYSYDVEDDDFETYRPEEVPPSKQVYAEKLALHCSAMNPVSLTDCLNKFTRLKEFSYDYGGAIVASADSPPSHVRKALLTVKDTLEVLKLDIDNEMGGHDLFPYPFGSLAEFKSLKSITLDANFLLGTINPHNGEAYGPLNGHPSYVDLGLSLPPTLEYLELTNCSPTTAPHLLSFAHTLDKFPSMRKVALDICDYERQAPAGTSESGYGYKTVEEPGFTKEEARRFRELCGEREVEVWMPHALGVNGEVSEKQLQWARKGWEGAWVCRRTYDMNA